MKQVKLTSGSVFIQTTTTSEKSSGEKTLEEKIEEECLQRNKWCKVNTKKSLHPSWRLRIKKEVTERESIKMGWKGTRINFTQIGNSNKAVIKDEVMRGGKKVKEEKREHFSKRKKLKKTKGLEWKGNRIEF